MMRARLLMAALSAALRTNASLVVDSGMRMIAPVPQAPATDGRFRAGYQRSRHTAAQEKRAALKARNKKRSKRK